MLPNVMQLCKSASDDKLDKLAGLGALMHMSWFRPQIIKAAAAVGSDHPLLQALMSLMAEAPQDRGAQLPAGGSEERDAALTSDISGSMGEDNEGDDDPTSHGDDDESQGEDDVIDAFMGDPKQAPPPTN